MWDDEEERPPILRPWVSFASTSPSQEMDATTTHCWINFKDPNRPEKPSGESEAEQGCIKNIIPAPNTSNHVVSRQVFSFEQGPKRKQLLGHWPAGSPAPLPDKLMEELESPAQPTDEEMLQQWMQAPNLWYGFADPAAMMMSADDSCWRAGGGGRGLADPAPGGVPWWSA